MIDQKAIRGFYHYNESWYSGNPKARGFVDQIMIGLYYEGGGTDGEFCIRWEILGSRSVPRLQVFNDAWKALSEFKDLLSAMDLSDGKNTTPMEMCEVLKNLGIKDLTDRINPYLKTEATQ